jgi:hypothetical protein
VIIDGPFVYDQNLVNYFYYSGYDTEYDIIEDESYLIFGIGYYFAHHEVRVALDNFIKLAFGLVFKGFHDGLTAIDDKNCSIFFSELVCIFIVED